MNLIDILIVLFFFIGMFVIGAIFYRWVGSSDDFYLAGRHLTPFILAAVIAATNINMYSFIGQSGIAYKEGISIVWQTWTGNMAPVFSGLFVVPIFRRLKIRTIPEFLQARYSKGVRTFLAIIWLFRLTFWLGIVLYTVIVAAQTIVGQSSFALWAIMISSIVIIYTMLGGMWSVTFTDVLQFELMLLGSLIMMPLAMHAVGWYDGLKASLPPDSLTLVKSTGTYNWKFIIAIFLLGIEWATIDQGLLQRAFSAKNTKSVARGLVLAGIITTPFAMLWILPGLAARPLFPHLANPDSAVPTLIEHLIPHGVLGLIVVGLLSSQLSTISGNLNSVATIFTSDIYTNVLKRKSTEKRTIMTARIATALAGVAMILFAYWVPRLGGAVNAYLTVIAIMDMPLFVITVVYGLLWKKVSWQSAIIGYVLGAASGVIAQFVYHIDFNVTTFVSAAVALITTPIAVLFYRGNDDPKVSAIWEAKRTSQEEIDLGDVYNIVPKSFGGRVAMSFLFAGLATFFVGTLMGTINSGIASYIAVTGMVIYFISGLVRTYFN
ncbi:MAG: sodium:solute symporter family protein [Bacteroidota bacterium]